MFFFLANVFWLKRGDGEYMIFCFGGGFLGGGESGLSVIGSKLLSLFWSFWFPPHSFSLIRSVGHIHVRVTEHLKVPYFVTDSFAEEYTGTNLKNVEKSVEDDYIANLRNNCWKEKQQSEWFSFLKICFICVFLLCKSMYRNCVGFFLGTGQRDTMMDLVFSRGRANRHIHPNAMSFLLAVYWCSSF